MGAYAWLAISHVWAWSYWGEPIERHHSLAVSAAERAVSLDRESGSAHTAVGYVLFHDGKLEEGERELMTALQVNPNYADAWAFFGIVKAFGGSASEGRDCLQKAFLLNPHPPGWYYWHLGIVEYVVGRYDIAVETLRHEATRRLGSQRVLAASLAQLGHMEEAKMEAAQFLAAHPNFSVQQWADIQPFRHQADRQHFIGVSKLGCPSNLAL